MVVADVAIIGAGVVGIALARQLQLCTSPPPTVALVEALPTVLCGASSGNSAMIHCGFDCTTGTLEHRMVVRGHQLFAGYAAQCAQRRVYLPWVPSGAIMLAMSESDMSILRRDIHPKALANGVTSVRLLSRDEVLQLEPHVHQDVLGGLHVPEEWIVDPWAFPALLLAEAAATPQLTVVSACRVTKVLHTTTDNGTKLFTLYDNKGASRVTASAVVNCAGLKGDVVEALCPGAAARLSFQVFPRLGRFVQFGPAASPLVQRALLPIPTKKSKGIIVFRTVFGQVFVGPTAEDPDEPKAPQAAVVKVLCSAAASKVPLLQEVPPVGAYAGARPALRDVRDYVVDLDTRSMGWFTIAGVRSTGLTASLALAEFVAPHVMQRLRKGLPIARQKVVVLPAKDNVAASMKSLLASGVLSVERRHPISMEGCPSPKL